MIFAHDTEDALEWVAALVNTASGGEQLPDVATLDALLRGGGWTGRRDRSLAELHAVQALRPRFRKFWELKEAGIVTLINELLRDGRALPQLVKHDEWDYHVHATPSDAPLATRMAVEAAMAMVDVVRTKELARLRICELEGCTNVVVDLTKNRSKLYCDAGCGNRAAVAAYRARQKRAGDPSGTRRRESRARSRGRTAGRPTRS